LGVPMLALNIAGLLVVCTALGAGLAGLARVLR
jgi:hypothetical protein